MAKKLLLDALTKALGEFVDGINAENFKLGIWNGKVGCILCVPKLILLTVPHPSFLQVSLSNLVLNGRKLQELDLPVSIVSGSLRTLEVINSC